MEPPIMEKKVNEKADDADHSKDADGNRYEIENYNKLDTQSIALLETQM